MMKINYTLVEKINYIKFLMTSCRFYDLGNLNLLKNPLD
jgi:hypothetical protein